MTTKVIQIRAPEHVQAQHSRFVQVLKANGMHVWAWLEEVESKAIEYYEWKAKQKQEGGG